MTPWEWLGTDNQKWGAFEARCNKFYKEGRLSRRKLELLLNKGNEYPENNPTELARVGARIGNFQQELIELFKRYGLEEPQTLFSNGKPVIQDKKREKDNSAITLSRKDITFLINSKSHSQT